MTASYNELTEALQQVQRMLDSAARGKDGRAFVDYRDFEATAAEVRRVLSKVEAAA